MQPDDMIGMLLITTMIGALTPNMIGALLIIFSITGAVIITIQELIKSY